MLCLRTTRHLLLLILISFLMAQCNKMELKTPNQYNSVRSVNHNIASTREFNQQRAASSSTTIYQRYITAVPSEGHRQWRLIVKGGLPPQDFLMLKLFRYDSALDQWTAVPLKGHANRETQTVLNVSDVIPTKVALYYAVVQLDDQCLGTLIYNAPVAPNDIMVRNAPAERIAAPVPQNDGSVRIRFVPDPALLLKALQR